MSFTLLQQGTRQTGTGSVALTLPSNASAQNTLLLAVLFNGNGNTFTAPAAPAANTGWQFARRIQIQGVNVELWHMVNNIGGLYFAAGATFTATGSCAGFLYEFSSPPNTTQVFDTVGIATGNGLGTAMPVSTAAGCFNGSLGILVPLQNFSSSVTGQTNQWVTPAGFTRLGQISNGVANFYALMYNGSLSTAGAVAGGQSATTGYNYSGTPTPTGWGVIYAVYRSTTATTIHVDGAEPTNCLDLDPTGQMLFVGGDVEGCWRSADYGQNWQRACYGFNGADEVSFADVKWSLIQPGYLYAMTGKAGRAGGFCASADGGCTWQLLNSQVSYYGNATPSNPRPAAENQDSDRGVGQSLAQDVTNGLLYTVTGNLGVCRSADNGNTWTPIGPSGFWNVKTMFPRCIIINQSNPAQLFVGMWDIGNGNGGIFTTTNANASSATAVTWTQIVGSGIVGQLKQLGTYVYAAYHTGGVFRYNISDGSWTSLNQCANSLKVDTTGTSLWLTIDGFIDSSGNHNLFVGCSNGVARSGSTKPNYTNVIWLQCPGGNLPATYTDLTGAATINLATIPPYNNAWWHAGASWQFWLGGNDSVNPHILVDPNTTGNVNGPTLYLSNSGGWFICQNPFATPTTAITWQLSVAGMEIAGNHGFAIDPNMGTHFISRGSDYTSIDVGYSASGTGDPTGGTPSQVVATGPGASLSGHHRESHALCFDPADSRVYVGLNTAYSQPDGGAVMYRTANPNSTWHSTSYDTQVPTVTGTTAPAVIGMAAGSIGGARWAIAIAQGSGPWYWNGTSWRKGAMVSGDNSPLPGSSSNVPGQHADMAVGGGGAVYCYDRKNGLYRSGDQGVTWQQIWGVTTSDDRTGWIAINPNPPSGKTELWVGTDSGLYQLVGAGNGVVGKPGGPVVTTYGSGTVFAAGAAGVAFTVTGAVLAIATQAPPSPAPPVSTIYISYNNGATWADWTGGDSSAGSYMPPAGQLGISASGWLWASGGENFGLWGQIPTTTAALSGQGQMTANVQNTGKGTAALSGVGNLTANPTVAQTAFLSGTGTLTAAGTRSGPFSGLASLSGVGNLTAVVGLITSASIIPSYLPEQPVLIGDVNDWFTWNITYKTQATNRPGTTTLAPDPDLVLPVLPGASYEIRMVIFYDGAGNLAFNWAYPADAVMNMNAWYNDSSGNITGHSSAGTANHTAKTASDLTTEVLMVNANLQAGLTPGTLAFQWAQSSSNSSALTVEPNSLMMMRRIA